MSAGAAAPVQGKGWFQAAPQSSPGMHLAYTHQVGLEVAGAALQAHFVAARDGCLSNPALHCLLLSAQLGTPPVVFATGRVGGARSEQAPASASLRVRLPHDQVAAYATTLTQPLPGETPGVVRVVRQSTTAEDLGRPIADVGQRVAQLQDYLASLKALGSRLTISVSDLVKIASETAQAQTQIEAAQAEQRDLAQQVATEALDVDYQEQAAPPQATDPIAQVVADSQAILRENMADALRVSIAGVPWLPVGLVALILAWIARRMLVGRRR